ncbi:methyl-accepting chemotaxis protein [Brevibacillus thermoruber]|uniref:Methyl-accepting chemotaxis protein n=1 Tax=Brevibacillus thermoruber TaxID=33942 RepID=A0A9X3Z368_9BACL|nr:methyl-accepting chemotaxis protein [Brevibacillus thermoruber]MDA5108571.1 methyl-accepting chemotaxis protein [Brevibacillus thermoruber]
MKSLKNTLVSILALVTVVIFVFQSGVGFVQFKSIIFGKEESLLQMQVAREAAHLDGILNKTGRLAEALSYTVAHSSVSDIQRIEGALLDVVGADNLIVGGGFWMEPYSYDPGRKLFGRYAIRNEGKIYLDPQYSDGSYDYLSQDWYKAGLVDKKMVWTEPYPDPISKVPMITAVSAIRHGGKIVGTVTVDIGLTELTKSIENLKVGETGYGFIVSHSGTFVAHRDQSKNMQAKITDESEAGLRELGPAILEADKPGFATASIGGSEHYVTYSPIGDTGMTLVTVMPKAEIMGSVNQFLYTSTAIFLVAISVFLVTLYWFVNRQVAVPLKKLSEGIVALAEHKDLSSRFEVVRRDEIGRVATALNHFVTDLYDMMKNINRTAGVVEEVSRRSAGNANEATMAFTRVAESFREVAAGTENQLYGAEESARAMEEMAIGIQRIAEASATVAEASRDMAGQAAAGSESIDKVSSQMQSIQQSVSYSNEVVQKLDSRSHEISQIVEAISDIASQTNLLALNAAIEAARAGEQGRGFAVVADEVRKLAEQSNESASRIAGLIAEIQKETALAVEAMQTGTEQVHTGIIVASESGEAFRRIMESTQYVADQIQEISAVAEQMSAASEQVTASIAQLSNIAKASADSAASASGSAEEQLRSMNELSASADNLSRMARDLQQLIEKFKL